jgi:hypothetical protein
VSAWGFTHMHTHVRVHDLRTRRFVRTVLLLATVVAMLGLAGCAATAGPDFVPAEGPHIKPLNIACLYPPVPKVVGFINTPVEVTPLFNGDWLVADGGTFDGKNSKVVMFSPKGKPIFAITSGSLRFVHSAYLTTRGNILISDTGNNRVIEVDPKTCKVVFNTDDLGPGHGFLGRGRLSDGSQLIYPNDAKEIPNGHYLISSRLTNTVFEIDRHGHVFWKCSKFYNPWTHKMDGLAGQHNPQRLPNGDTLISDSDNGRVVEVNPGCTRLVWQYTGRPLMKNGVSTYPFGNKPLIWPRDAMKMANGDILIDDSIHNRCLEVNMKHQVVRKYYDLPQPYSCWPMADGLVATGDLNTHGIALFGPGSPQAALVALIPHTPAKNPAFKPPYHLVNGDFETEASTCVVGGCQSAPGCSDLGSGPSGGVLGWSLDDLLTESLPPGAPSPLSFTKSTARCGYSSGEITWEHLNPATGKIAEHAPLLFSQVIHVWPYRKYTMTGYLKLDNVRQCHACDFGKGSTRGKYAYFGFVPYRSSPWANPTFSSFPKLTGTTITKDGGWVHQSETFYIPQGVHYVNVECILTGAGTVYFDGVSVRETPWRQTPGT